MSRWAVPAVTASTLLLCYASSLRGMFDQWMTDEDMGHGIVVPFVILWIVWRERKRWQELPAVPSAWGLAILALGLCLQLASALGAGLFAGSLAFLVSVTGVVLCIGGFARLRAWTFPLLLALFMLPKLAFLYNQITLPLQLLASRMAAGILSMAGFAVALEGNILGVGGRRIWVAEACSGIRYLLSLGFIAVVFAYLSDPKPWMRMALLAAAVPVAILANAGRVAAVGWWPALESGKPHEISGWCVFLACMAALVGTHRLLNVIYGRYHA